MVFSSLPAYLDPSNWHQHQQQLQQQQDDQDPNDQHNRQQNYHQGGAANFTNPLLPPPPLPPPPPPPQQLIAPHHLSHQQQQPQQHAVRPRSMAERARMANIPMPEASLKCPRCDSTNTKFCYFNNYSLSQPRHFCKACRRYWTRGGALRSVPVGGGCRRNKRSKSSSTTGGTGSKSSPGPSTSDRPTGSTSVARSSSSGANMAADVDLDLTHLPPMSIPMPMPMHMPSQQLRFMTMSPLHQYFSSSPGTTTGGGIGDHFGDHQLLSAPLSSINNNHDQTIMAAGNIHQLGSIINGGSTTGSEQWRMQPPQFPFLGGAAPAGLMTDSHSPTNNTLLYPFEGSSPHQHHQYRGQLSRFGVGAASTATNTTKINSSPDHHQGLSSTSTAKMEATTPPYRHQYQEMNLSTQFNLGGLLSGQYGHAQSHATNIATSASVAGDYDHTTSVSAAAAAAAGDHEFSSNSWGGSPEGNNAAPNAWTTTTTTT